MTGKRIKDALNQDCQIMSNNSPVQGAVIRERHGYEYADLFRLYRAYRTPIHRSYSLYNCYGVVVRWDESPKRSKEGSSGIGGDYYRTYILTDFSLCLGYCEDDVDSRTIKLVCFAPDIGQLPLPRSPGDIIRLHRVGVRWFNGPQIIASLSANKGGKKLPSSFCLWQASGGSADGLGYEPFQRSSRTFHWDEREAKVIDMIREFVTQNELWIELLEDEGPTAGACSDMYRRNFSELLPEGNDDALDFSDVQGIVLHVQKGIFVPGVEEVGSSSPSHSPAKMDTQSLSPGFHGMKLHCADMIYLWDGSDARQFPISRDNRLIKEVPSNAHGLMKKYKESYVSFMTSLRRRDLNPKDCDPEIVPYLPGMGTAMPIVFPPSLPGKRPTELPRAGSCIRIRNCGFHIINGQVQGICLKKSKWQPAAGAGPGADPEDDIALQLERRKKEHDWNTFAPSYPAEWITEIKSGHRDRQFSTLRQVLCWCTQNKISGSMLEREESRSAFTASFRCLVHVVSTSPSIVNVEAWCAGDPDRKSMARDSHEEWSFNLTFTVADSTGAIENARLMGADARYFFSHVATAEDIAKDENARQRLSEKMLGVLEDRNSHEIGHSKVPWMEICIEASQNTQEDLGWSFRIFDTLLK